MSNRSSRADNVPQPNTSAATMALSTPTTAGATSDRPSTVAHSPPESETVSSSRCSMLSSTAAQVMTHPAMTQPRNGNTGDVHGAPRSRRSTSPMLTALNDMKAKAMVIETEPAVVLGLPGPQVRIPSAMAATTNPLTSQRMTCGVLTILVPGLRGGRCMTPESGTSTMNPIT